MREMFCGFCRWYGGMCQTVRVQTRTYYSITNIKMKIYSRLPSIRSVCSGIQWSLSLSLVLKTIKIDIIVRVLEIRIRIILESPVSWWDAASPPVPTVTAAMTDSVSAVGISNVKLWRRNWCYFGNLNSMVQSPSGSAKDSMGRFQHRQKWQEPKLFT